MSLLNRYFFSLRQHFFHIGKFLLTYRGVFLYFSLGWFLFMSLVYTFSCSFVPLFWALIVVHVLWTDMTVQRISVFTLGVFLVFSLIWGGGVEGSYLPSGLFLGGAAWFTKALSEKWYQQHSLGWGDVWLLAGSGLWMPLAHCPSFLVLVGLSGGVWGGLWYRAFKKKSFPLGGVIVLCLSYILFYR